MAKVNGRGMGLIKLPTISLSSDGRVGKSFLNSSALVLYVG